MVGFPFDSQLTYDEHDNPVYDRPISSQPLRELLRDLFSTGVMPNPSNNLQVSAGLNGMTVLVQPGYAVIDGGLCKEDDARTLVMTAADSTYDRIDTVVVRWNENLDVRTADLYIKSGTPSDDPVRPELQRDNSIYEIGLADVFIPSNSSVISNERITDTRYETSRCGIVSSVSQWDTTTIYQQIQADLYYFKANEQARFLSWFAQMQGQLSTDAAGHLQQEIDALESQITETVNTQLAQMQQQLTNMQNNYWKTIYPIGAIYLSYDSNFNPNTSFGGTWTKIEDKFLLASGTKALGATGGAETHTLTVAQLPSYYLSVGDPGHAHGFTAGGGAQNDNIAQAGAMDISVPYPNIGQATAAARTGISVHSGGSNQPHNNMPPYIVVDVWRREA